MQSTIDFFAELPSLYRTVLLVAGLLFFWILEGAIPLIPNDYQRVRHAALNLTLTFCQLLVAVSIGIVIVATATSMNEHEIGLLHWLGLNAAGKVIGGILLLDLFGGYWIHRIQHRFHILWRFHIVHHADPKIDVTTALRHHPVETVFRLSGQLVAVLIGGIPVGVVFMYQALAVFFAQLTHANVSPPKNIDRLLSWIFVTPNMHKVHHHFEKPLTDKNYGNVFAIWDRLFGTFVEVNAGDLEYGIDSLPSASEHSRVSSLLTLPFRKSDTP